MSTLEGETQPAARRGSGDGRWLLWCVFFPLEAVVLFAMAWRFAAALWPAIVLWPAVLLFYLAALLVFAVWALGCPWRVRVWANGYRATAVALAVVFLLAIPGLVFTICFIVLPLLLFQV